MRLASRLRAHLLRSPVYVLLSQTAPAAAASANSRGAMKQSLQHQYQQQQLLRGRPAGSGVGATGLKGWMFLMRRRLIVACRPRNLVRIFGAALVALLLVIIVTKGYSWRRRSLCRCTKFAYSQCQPYDGNCGAGVKKAFCQQRRCQPRRKLVRCSLSCDAAAAADKHAVPGGQDNRHLQPPSPACAYAVRRQSRWTRCSEGSRHRSRLLFLQSGSPPECPAIKTERRSCKSEPRRKAKKSTCIYEPQGSWSACNRDRNEIVNVRRLTGVSASPGDCPMELRTAMRCLKRDGSLRCIYSKWSKWSQCVNGARHKVRTHVQGDSCSDVKRLVQNCTRHTASREQ